MQGNSKKQKYLIDSILSSPDVFAKCIGILKPEYFDREYADLIQFTIDYYNDYHAIPGERIVNAQFDVKFKPNTVTTDEVEYVCKEVETFCKEAGLVIAVRDSLADIETKNYNAISERVSEALSISLDTDLGIDFFKNIKERLEASVDQNTHEPTGIKAIDDYIGGGLIRKQMTIFSANSGGGKSIMMNNIGLNFMHKGFRVVYISLELPEDMIDIRSAAMWSNIDASKWAEQIPYMAEKIKQGERGGGGFHMKRLPQGSCANDFRAYLKQYEIKYGCSPDMLLIDYLDLMAPNGGVRNLNVSDKDKYCAEQVTEILHQYNMFGISASQQNREAIGNSAPDQSVIAGGLTKVNTTDNYISIYMDPAMRLIGKMFLYFLKTRSSDGVGKQSEVSFDTKTLRISDVNEEVPYSVMPKRRIEVEEKEELEDNPYVKLEIHDEKPEKNQKNSTLDSSDTNDMDTDTDDVIVDAMKKITQPKTEVKNTHKKDDGLMSLMSSIHGGDGE